LRQQVEGSIQLAFRLAGPGLAGVPDCDQLARYRRQIMARILAVLTLMAATVLPALAALPPHYQRQRELEAVLSAAVEALGIGNPVDRVEMTAPDEWNVMGGDCHITMTVVDAPTEHEAGWVGPREFAVEPGDVVCH
jgi:hypothetical protein